MMVHNSMTKLRIIKRDERGENSYLRENKKGHQKELRDGRGESYPSADDPYSL